jgi:membrane-bound lytic murein transglycosylase F
MRKSKYDPLFKQYSEKYFPDLDWLWFKAQSIAESNLNPLAESMCHAKGLMQLMPNTFTEISKVLHLTNIVDPESNIHAGIYYDRKMYDIWKVPRPINDRLALMFASYNAGVGNILKAQRLCKLESLKWNSIVAVASSVASWKSKETIAYVSKIFALMDQSLTEKSIENIKANSSLPAIEN